MVGVRSASCTYMTACGRDSADDRHARKETSGRAVRAREARAPHLSRAAVPHLAARDSNQMALTFERMGSIENDLAMVMPRLTGTGDDGFPFVVTAATAVQESR